MVSYGSRSPRQLMQVVVCAAVDYVVRSLGGNEVRGRVRRGQRCGDRAGKVVMADASGGPEQTVQALVRSTVYDVLEAISRSEIRGGISVRRGCADCTVKSP